VVHKVVGSYNKTGFLDSLYFLYHEETGDAGGR